MHRRSPSARSKVIPLVAAAVPLTVMSGAIHDAGAQVGVGSDGSRVAVSGYRAGGEVHVGFTVSGPIAAVVQCRELVSSTDAMVDVDGASASPGWPALDPTRTPRSRYWLECHYPDGTLVALGEGALGFVYEDEVVDVDAVVRALARRYAGETLAPVMSIAMSPPVGLVGIEQWFWISGWDGSPAHEVHDVVGHQVDVELRLAGVDWHVGEGAPIVLDADGLGGPGGSAAVVHTYTDRSTSDAAPDATLAVSATVRIAASYRLDGAGPYDVTPAVEVPLSTSLVVREAQAVVWR